MIPGLPSPWLILGGVLAFLGAAIAGYTYGLHHQAAIDMAAIEHQKAEAAQTLASETVKVLAKERENAELNATLEKERADHETQIAIAGADLDSRMSQWMRAHPGCRSGGGSTPSQAGSASGPALPPAISTELLPSGSGAFIQRCSAAADELSAYARECHAFVTTLEH